jgi:predicted O-methyltransferase YrrM
MPEPTPQLFFETANSYQRSAAIRAAIELGLFTAIAHGANSAAVIAAKCKAAERGIRVLCDYLTVHGFLTKSGNAYALTPDTALFLNTDSPAYLGCAIDFLLNPTLIKAFDGLTEAVRKGGTAIAAEHTLDTDHAMWTRFARGMAPLMFGAGKFIGKLVAESTSGPIEVLDIAAGHGVFGVSVAQACPEAKITAQDWPHVLEVATENAAKAGVSARHRLLPGNAFGVDFGGPYDVVLLTNFMHHFDAATNETLLRKIAAALKPNGRVITLEFVPNPDRVTPPNAAAFSLTMLATTASGDAYTFAELESMFKNAGFTKNTTHALPGGFQTVVVSIR